MEPIVHHLAELCRELTPVQFRLAIPPLMRYLPTHPVIGSQERAAECIAAVFNRLNMNPNIGGIRPTRYERQLAEDLWSWKMTRSASDPPGEDMVFELSAAELVCLQICFERLKAVFEGTVLGYFSNRPH
ncbi:hypothetical protein SAMN02949497_3026 [Methylomagnum ishizawai]|uniref:Uncharacterized protein n=1 Tax=Methylomagnum ishizawai TaxID=1760988 RepID=A0A1Y6CZC3_9GAMM|nr:hypothetical protein [Methylomagnum ishizawai]SMF95656.1 hypothetical protein SAMN02949497_3026 [Methylomagnum ishizawai]